MYRTLRDCSCVFLSRFDCISLHIAFSSRHQWLWVDAWVHTLQTAFERMASLYAGNLHQVAGMYQRPPPPPFCLNLL